MDSAKSAKLMGSHYFFCTTEDRDAFAASHRASDSRVPMVPVGELQERRFKASSATPTRACPSFGRSSAPDASFLG